MRDFAKLAPQFWIGATGRKLHQGCPEATVVAAYLISGPQSTMLGLYYLPKIYLAHESGLGVEGAEKGLRRAIEAGFCQYDEDTEMVYIPEMARFQIAEQLEAKDNRVRWVQRAYDALPENPFLAGFYEKYATAFHLKKSRGKKAQTISPLEAPCKPLRSQEKEKEQLNEQEQDFEQEKRAGEGEGDRGRGNGGTKTFPEPNQNQSQPLSTRRKKEIQDQKLLQGEVKLYREAHGREPDYLAVLKISEKTHLPFEYAQRLLSEPAMQGNGRGGTG